MTKTYQAAGELLWVFTSDVIVKLDDVLVMSWEKHNIGGVRVKCLLFHYWVYVFFEKLLSISSSQTTPQEASIYMGVWGSQ